ncbi:MAG TPA: hypothetical protein VF024_20500 [Solirubrobacteraceae bacterium]
MTLFLQNDAGGSGTGGVFPDRGFGHLVQIANMDTGIGQNAAVGDLIQVTYTETLTGIPPDRLDNLVNTDFSGVPGTTDIIVIPVDETFVRPNGHHVTENAGLTFPVGHSENPTSSVLIVYDTSDNNGGGYCLPAEGGGTVGFPGAVILYHELSHALRMATSSQLDNSDTGCTANPEEHQAEIDENDMRDQLGVGHRDTTQHCATTGCTSNCCVVASVATGSPYSADVNELRRLRDDSLRGSEVGFDFFERLHYDYYAFSPQVVRMMERAPDLRGVSAGFVVPLTRCLQLLRSYTERRPGAVALGERFEAGLRASPELAGLSAQDIALALALLRSPDEDAPGLPAELAPLAELLRDRASRSPYIRWALLDTIEIYLAAAGRRLEGDGPEQLGRWLSHAFDAWGADLPLTDVWQRLSDYAIGEELGFLRRRLLPSPPARARFAGRLSAHLAARPAIDALLEREEYHLERSAV